MPASSSCGVFLSYRREDAGPYARLLQYQLRERLPETKVFIDLDSIEAGLEFDEVIRDAVASCVVLIALMGRQWATIEDEEGHRRLDNPDDLVRFEIQLALERGVRVIPVLVDDARPPRQAQLPPELHRLAKLNALELSYSRYDYDASRLINLVQQVLAQAAGTQMSRDLGNDVSADDESDTESVDMGRQGMWTRNDLQDLYSSIEHLTGALALLDLAAERSPEIVTFPQVVARSGLTAAEQAGAHSSLSWATKRLFGSERGRWPVDNWQATDGEMHYRMPTLMARWWQEIRSN
jgi:hypothetical protein